MHGLRRAAIDRQFNEPHGVAVDSAGDIYVADTWNSRIQVFSANGSFLRTWTREFYTPFAVAVDASRNVYVLDSANHRVQKFTSTGSFLTQWGTQGTGDGQFSFPKGIAVSPNGTVYVADADGHRIQRFSSTGGFLGKWGSQGTGDGQFQAPYGVAVGPDGTVYVSDQGNSRIQRFSATGAFLGKWGSPGSGDGQFSTPAGVAVAPDGTVYVADWNNHRIQRFSATGSFLGQWGSQGGGSGQFQCPAGVAVDRNGGVYIAERGSTCRIQAFGTSYPSTWRGEYHGNTWLTGAPALIRDESQISFNWGSGSPGAGIPTDGFSARWYKPVWLEGGQYRFTLTVDDGARFWVDDQLLVDEWQGRTSAATFQRSVQLSQGYHRLLLEYYEGSGNASVALSWVREPSPATVKVSPASKRAPLSGGTFTIDIVAEGVSNLGGYQVEMTYNPTIAQVTAVMPGPFLGSTGRTVSPVGPTIDNMSGLVRFGAFTFGTQAGVNGTGVLATITFQPQTRGTSALHLQNLLLTDPSSNLLSAGTEDGQVEVVGCFGDFDGDNDVDIIDLQRAASHWNCRMGDACYELQFDTEPDGDIDVYDLQRFAAAWGINCTTTQARQPAGSTSSGIGATAVGLRLAPASVQVIPGDVFSLTVQIQGATNVGAFQTDVSYDPLVVQVEGITLGAWLGSTGRTISPLGPIISNTVGRVTFGAFSFGSQAGASGSGDLATIRLRAAGVGQTRLSFERAGVSDTRGEPLTLGNLEGCNVTSGHGETPTPTATGTALPGVTITPTPRPTAAGTATATLRPSLFLPAILKGS